MLKVSQRHKTTVTIDDVPIRIQITRLTIEEMSAFMREFSRIGFRAARGERAVDKKRRELEAALTNGEPRPSDLEVQALVDADLTDDERAAHEARDVEAAASSDSFARSAISSYVTVEPDQIVDEDTNHGITEGADLVRLFGSRVDVVRDALAAIFFENRLSADAKKNLKSVLAFSPTSDARLADPAGERPAPTATAAAPSTTAEHEAVTGSSETT